MDVGTSYIKGVIIGGEDCITGSYVLRSGADLAGAIDTVLEGMLSSAGVERSALRHITSTGFGRRNVTFADNVKTEISCHAKGAYHHFGEALTLIDIGGQDTKIIRVGDNGKLMNFKMNRKCAAGTGSFLEEIALRMDIPVGEMNGLAAQSESTEALGSFCTVFASSEILTRIRNGERMEDMARSAFESVARRIIEMDVFEGKIVMSGGVVKYNKIVVEILERHIGREITVAPCPQLVGAFGAALHAREEGRNR